MPTTRLDGARALLSRQSLKQRFPQLIPLVRLAKMTWNQVRYPVVASALEWRGEVIGGPFKGLRFRLGGAEVGYNALLGTHEQCLHPTIEEVIARRPGDVINVGASFGYYALGFAYRCPHARVIAYEADPSRAALIVRLRDLNAFGDRVEIRGRCAMENLEADLQRRPGALILMDVEGAEDVLLCPDQLPALRWAETLVEVHETFVPGVRQRLLDRFGKTHSIIEIQQTVNRKVEDYDTLDWFVRAQWGRLAAIEHESQTTWLHMCPRCTDTTNGYSSVDSTRVSM